MFSILTSKIFGGVAIALALLLVISTVSHKSEVAKYQKQLGKADRTIVDLRLAVAVAKANANKLEVGLTQCSASVDRLGSVVSTVSANSAAAAKAAQAKRSEMAERIERISRLPANTCEDVKALLKGGGAN